MRTMKKEQIEKYIARNSFGWQIASLTLRVCRRRINETMQLVREVVSFDGAQLGSQKIFWRSGSRTPINLSQGLPEGIKWESV